MEIQITHCCKIVFAKICFNVLVYDAFNKTLDNVFVLTIFDNTLFESFTLCIAVLWHT